MQLKTILNRVERNKSFVYGKATWVAKAAQPTIEVEILPRANSRPICSGCGRRGPGYDRLRERKFEYVPFWQIAVFFVYALRRVDCPRCGVKVEQVPWSDGKNSLTKTYRWFLAGWAQRLSWQQVAAAFYTTWDHVHAAVQHAVYWGLVHRELKGVESIGVDEVQWQRGHKYLTLVYQIDAGCKRLLWIGQERREESLRKFFDLLGHQVLPTLRYICSDMWQPYLDVIAEQASGAIHILDRFHIMANLNKAIDEVRAGEARRLKADGYEPVLKHSRWCLLKNPANRTPKQTVKLEELLNYNLQTVRAFLQREDFQRFWEYDSPTWAGKFLDEWCLRVMRSRIEPMKKAARTLRNHRELILNWFEARGTISSGVVEGMNNKVKLTTRKAYGFRTFDAVKLALYHNLAALPEPEFTHRFC
jgi:transposase